MFTEWIFIIMNNRIVYIVSSKMVRYSVDGAGSMMNHKGGVRPSGATESNRNPAGEVFFYEGE